MDCVHSHHKINGQFATVRSGGGRRGSVSPSPAYSCKQSIHSVVQMHTVHLCAWYKCTQSMYVRGNDANSPFMCVVLMHTVHLFRGINAHSPCMCVAQLHTVHLCSWYRCKQSIYARGTNANSPFTLHPCLNQVALEAVAAVPRHLRQPTGVPRS